MMVQPRTTPLLAWQYTEQPWDEWPSWVKQCCMKVGDVMRHHRPSGAQIVYPTEWLVKDLDGGVCFYTDVEFNREYVSRP